MAGAGLLEIKRRIKSVTNTKKITKAMGLVATSKLRKARQMLKVNDQYYRDLNDIANEIIYSADDIKNNIFVKNNNNSKKLFILLSSDTGLCGGFNANAANYIEEKYGDIKSNIATIIVGQKGIQYARKYKFETLSEYVAMSEIPTMKEAGTIVNRIMKEFKDGNFGEINLVYTHFKSPVVQMTVEEKLLPLSNGTDGKAKSYTIEPDGEEVLDTLVVSYLKSKIIHGMCHSRTSEQSARMQAMDGASKNADDILSALNTKYNRIRQSLITQEISEIVGGAEAQK